MEKALKTLGKMRIYQENIIRVPRQQVGEPGIGGICGAERGKLRHWGKWVTTVLLRVRKRKKSRYFKTFFVIMYLVLLS